MDEAQQEQDWAELYKRIVTVLERFGVENAFGQGDYWVLDDNWGPPQQKVCIFNLKMLEPEIVYAMQRLLPEFPGWSIVVAVDVPGTEKKWPAMGLIVRPDEIIDGLQRRYFPLGFQSLRYAGSRPGTDKD